MCECADKEKEGFPARGVSVREKIYKKRPPHHTAHPLSFSLPCLRCFFLVVDKHVDRQRQWCVLLKKGD